ncbi:MAG: hypothetical protein QXX51_08145 [Candidatus Bathyarchaeia archaeon]
MEISKITAKNHKARIEGIAIPGATEKTRYMRAPVAGRGTTIARIANS